MKKLLFLAIVLCFSIAEVKSQSRVNRKGILFGAALGASTLHLRSAQQVNSTDLAINWKVGYVLTPKLAVLLNGAVSIYDSDRQGRTRKRDFGGLFPAVQYFPARRVWVLGGVGVGTDAPVFYDLNPENKEETKYYSGLGGVAAIGYELYQKGNFTLDVQGRVTYGSVQVPQGSLNGLTTGLLLGFTFY